MKHDLIAMLLLPLVAYGQGLLNESWALVIDGPQAAKDVAWGLDLDSLGNIYWATSQTTFGGNRKDILTYKIAPDGTQRWSSPHVYGNNFEQQAYHCVFSRGIAYIAGRSWQGAFINSSDALLYAIDTLRQDTLWTYIWDGGYGYEEVDGLVIEEHAIFISGWTWGDSTSQDAFITKLDINGNALWTTTWGSPNYDQCDGHCVVDDSTVYICGLYDLSTAGDAYLAAFDKHSGAYKWHTLWGGAGTEDALGMESDGTFIYQCGNTSSFGDSTVFINKYDKNGNLIWTAFTGKAFKTRSLAFPGDGSLYLAATSNTLGARGEEVLIMQYDTATGALMDYRSWGGVGDEVVHDIRIQHSYLYLTGRTTSFSAGGDFDAFLIKAPLFSNPTAIDKAGAAAAYPLAYPNPASAYFRINLPASRRYELTIFDLYGRLQLRVAPYMTNQLLPILHLRNGVYQWQVAQENGQLYSGKILVHH